MLIMVFAIFICTVSATCAADANETTIATQEDNQMELTLTEDEIQTNENDNMLTQTEDAEILTSGEGTYSDLRNEIKSGNLTKSHYRYNDGDGGTIEIKTPGVINGNGAVIDMNGSNIRTFYVRASGVTIKNLTIINANYNGDGGAIYFYSTGTVSNCNFTANNATGDGGAVYFNGKGEVTNCNFAGNTAGDWGGAIKMYSGTVSNCNFTGNTANDDGGAVYFRGTGEVTNCNFTGNTASELGGAVYFYRPGTVSNCNFTGNTASINGGAVYFDETGTVSNCNFTGNTATGDGGAIYFTQDATGNVINCNFTNNSAMGGGAVYFNSTGEVICCNFVNNCVEILEDCEGGGGALRFSKDGTIINCNFINNVAVESWGAAVYFDGHDATGTIITCNFTNNAATVDGGAISFNNHNIAGNVRSCNFANNTGRWGGAIDAAGICNVSSCNFSYNKALDGSGGAIYFNLKGEVTDCNFIGNSVWGKNNDGGAIQIYSGKVTRCNFTDNSASSDGGAISFSLNTEVTNCNFANNKAISGEGGAIYIWDTYGTGSTIENCSFINNQATSGHGGAIYFRKFCNVENCNFTGNTATGDGGAVYFRSTGTVANCNFTGNNATTGSAIYFYKWDSSDTLTVSNSTFLNNRANAGALDIVKTENNITITFTGQNNLLNAIYSREDAEVAFTNVTYWGAKGITTVSATMSGSNKAAGQKITVGVVVNNEFVLNEVNVTDENGMIVLLIIAGENYYISARHDTDSYYTEAEKTITNNIDVNVTSQTTTNKTVNITAKSNIPQDVVQGKLLFILPDGTADGMVIEANYAGNGTWWAEHTFDAYGEYKVNATYVGLDNVTITNATISISKTPTEITVENETLELLIDDSIATGATLTPADAGNVTYTVSDSSVVKVEDGIIKAVGEGTAIITVSFAENDDYAEAENKTIKVTVIKYDSKVIISPIADVVYPNNVTITYTIENKTNVTVSIDGVSDDKIIITNDTITVIGLDAGEYTIVVINNESSIYHQSNDTKTFTVNKQATSITAADVSTTYNINKELVITLKDANGNPLTGASITVDLNGAKTYTTDKNGQVKVSTKGLAPKAYTAKAIFNGDTNYDKSTKDIKVTVKKATPKLTAKKKTFKTTPKTKKYTIVLKDNTGKAIKKAKVTLKVKGKTYKATTNSKGKATFKITKLNKKGTFKATITYKGNKYYNKVSKKANIKVIVTFKTVSKGSKDKATVKEIQQALKDKGYYLTYQGHYLKVDGKFKGCTERSLKEFQKDNGLKVTGKVDEKTAKKLGIL